MMFLVDTNIFLPIERYKDVVSTNKRLRLDFDDAYQHGIAKYYDLKLATMDTDFKKVKDIEVVFI